MIDSTSSSTASETVAVPTNWHIMAARAADDKIGTDTIVIDVGDVIAITDYFVVTSGSNKRQVRAIVDFVEEEITMQGGPKPLRIEGLDTSAWVLMDFGEFVVHVFSSELREYYELERLWGDRPRVAWQESAS